jgi:aspartyl-tRNA synthetase
MKKFIKKFISKKSFHNFYDKKFFRDHFCSQITETQINQKVKLCGWIENIRSFGEELVFILLRDKTGKVQIKLLPKEQNNVNLKELKNESVVFIEGIVQNRPGNNKNDEMRSGSLEIDVTHIEILNQSKILPIQLSNSVKIYP